MKKIKTYPNHLEIITSVLIKILIQKISQMSLQDIMNAPVCIENGRMCPNARTPQKGHYQCK